MSEASHVEGLIPMWLNELTSYFQNFSLLPNKTIRNTLSGLILKSQDIFITPPTIQTSLVRHFKRLHENNFPF